MKSQKIAQNDAPHQFEPLLPAEHKLGPLLEQANDVSKAATKLGSAAVTAQQDLRLLLRSMNSYYTNKLEGEHTRPIDIERALQQEFSANADLARRQRLAVAHIETEERCEQELDADPAEEGWRALYSAARVQWLHRQLFEGLQDADLRLSDKSQLVAGEFRSRQVAVGRHEPPAASALREFLQRWSEVYGRTRRGELSIVAAAASHHRLAWVHPFLDGNGRVARLHTHLLLHGMGLTRGLWSPLRGFARTEARYKALLAAADEHRRGDLDGRGNLTEQGLVDWIAYALEVFRDQIDFMSGLLQVSGMQRRIEAALLQDASAGKGGIRTEALRPLHYLFAAQVDLGRGDFKTMTGLGDRTATELLSALLRHGYLASDTAYGKVRFAIPRHALRHYFPQLWPEAEADADMLRGVSRERPKKAAG